MQRFQNSSRKILSTFVSHPFYYPTTSISLVPTNAHTFFFKSTQTLSPSFNFTKNKSVNHKQKIAQWNLYFFYIPRHVLPCAHFVVNLLFSKYILYFYVKRGKKQIQRYVFMLLMPLEMINCNKMYVIVMLSLYCIMHRHISHFMHDMRPWKNGYCEFR